MTWTYDDTLSTDRDKVRLRVGDIDTKDQLITDEAIAYILGLYGSDIPRTAYECAKIILAGPKMARAVDRNGTGFSATRSQRFQHLKDIVDQWEAQSRLAAGMTWCGSSISAEESLESSSDYVGAAFKARQFDND